MAERRLALVVATDRYDDGMLRGLAAPAADAEALADALGDPELGGFEVDVMSNATSWVIAEHVDGLLGDRRPSDLVLLHFSCHGLKDDSGELYLAATNTRPDRLTTTAVDAALVNRLMRRSRAQRVILLLDCCYGGAFERGVVARSGDDVQVGEQFAPAQLGGGRGRVVITASSAMEYAFEGRELTAGGKPAPSLFTSALVDGIRTGAADRDQDGVVSLDELYDHVHDTVQARTPNQTPSRWEFGVQGELVIARNPRRIVPRSLPTDLVRRAQDPGADDRPGAVDELGALARGADLGLAASAAEVLAPLVDDDSRRVSQAAQTVLEAIVPRPEQSLLDLGRIVCERAARAQVRVEGSPLALASTVQTSGAEVEARLEAGQLSVQVLPAQPGPVDASVTLLGPAGVARVDVVADAVPRGSDDADVSTSTSATPGPNMSVVVPLGLLGAVAIAAARALPNTSGDFAAHADLRGTEDLLLLPAVACLLALACLGRRSLVPIAVGTLAGAAAWSAIFWTKRTVLGLVDPEVGAALTVEGTFLTGHWARLVAALMLGIAVAVAVEGSPSLRGRIRREPGWRSTLAGLLVLVGAVIPVLELLTRREPSGPGLLAAATTEWTLLVVACLPVAVLRFDSAQRRAALTGVVALCLFTVVRDVWIVAFDADQQGQHFTVMVTAAAMVLAGCFLGQAHPATASGTAPAATTADRPPRPGRPT